MKELVIVYRLEGFGTWRLVVNNKRGSCSHECVSASYLHRMALASMKKPPTTAVILEFAAVKGCTGFCFQWSRAATTAEPTVVHCTVQGAGWIVVLLLLLLVYWANIRTRGCFAICTDGYVAIICSNALFPRLVYLGSICTSALFPRLVYLVNIWTSALFPRLVYLASIWTSALFPRLVYLANICTSELFTWMVYLLNIFTSALFPRPVYLASICKMRSSHDWFIWPVFVQVHYSNDRFIWSIFVQVNCSHD